MKVAINKCYGGFSISLEAIKELVIMGSGAIDKIPLEEFGSGYVRKVVDLGDGFTGHGYRSITDGKYVYSTVIDNTFRSHPDVIGVIERLGKGANGDHSDIRIVEIPDGIEWTIQEYDGIEWVAESHRTWG